MRPIINSTRLIAACGLYCGACRQYRRDKCPGCHQLNLRWAEQRQPFVKFARRCRIRRCCHSKGLRNCAQCEMDVRDCKTHNNLVGKLLALVFNSDRGACVRYIVKNGEEAYAEKMARDERMTMRRRDTP